MSDGKILVNYKGANQETISAGPSDLIRLNPGVNTVDAKMWDRVLESAKNEKKNSKIKTPKGGILFLIDNDLVAVVPAKGSGDGVETDENGLADLDKLKANEGIDIVNSCADVGDLNAYLAAEKGSQNRKTLVKAIENQIDALTKAAEEEANSKED